MKSFEVSFGIIKILQTDIAEIIINNGHEIDVPEVRECHEFLVEHLSAPFSVLINKLNKYSYSFDAQMEMGTLEQFNSIAIVSYTVTSELNAELLISSIPRTRPWTVKQFSNKTAALEWLQQEQNNTN